MAEDQRLQYTGEILARAINSVLEYYPGQESQRLLAQLVYLFIRGMIFYNVAECPNIPAYLESCGFDKNAIKRVSQELEIGNFIDSFAKENGLTSPEDKEILRALLSLKPSADSEEKGLN